MAHFDNIRNRIEGEYQARITQLDNIQRNSELLHNLSDSELRIYQKNPYFRYHKEKAVWPLTNFLECPELVADPAFQKLYQLYQQIEKADKFVGCGTEIDHPLQPIHRSLSELATKMANRSMTEIEYNSILNEDNEVLIKGYSMLEEALVPSP